MSSEIFLLVAIFMLEGFQLKVLGCGGALPPPSLREARLDRVL